jgi:hypothetical protein
MFFLINVVTHIMSFDYVKLFLNIFLGYVIISISLTYFDQFIIINNENSQYTNDVVTYIPGVELVYET